VSRVEGAAEFENCAKVGLNYFLSCGFGHGYSETNSRFHRCRVDGCLKCRDISPLWRNSENAAFSRVTVTYDEWERGLFVTMEVPVSDNFLNCLTLAHRGLAKPQRSRCLRDLRKTLDIFKF
jgi:hypothetical protein